MASGPSSPTSPKDKTKNAFALRLHLSSVNLPLIYITDSPSTPPIAARLEITTPSPGRERSSFMPPNILSSNIITVPVLDSILQSQAGQEQTYRLQLLSTKLAILTNRPSHPVRRRFDAELQILKCRLDLAKASMSIQVPNLTLASGELGLVERDCKGMSKRIIREIRARSDREARKDIGQGRGVETGTGTSAGSGNGANTGKMGEEEDGEYQNQQSISGTTTVSGSGSGSTIKAVKRDIDISSPPPEATVPSISTLSSIHIESSSIPVPIIKATPNDDDDDDDDDQTASISHSSCSHSSTTERRIERYQNRQGVITKLRVEALMLLGDVEELQGRPERRGRWDSLALKLEAG